MPILTNHAKNRMHSRIGITKGRSKKYIQRIFSEGIWYEDTLGKLQQIMTDRLYQSNNVHHRENRNTIIYYASALYIFTSEEKNGLQILVTVIDVEDEINKNLQDYVTKEAYRDYIKAREKHTRFFSIRKKEKEKKVKAVSDQNQHFLNIIRTYIKEHNIPIIVPSIYIKDKLIKIHYCSDTEKNDWNKYSDLISYMWVNYNKIVYLNKLKDLEGKYVTIERYKAIHKLS